VEQGLVECAAGSTNWLKFTEALQRLDERYREERAARGVDPARLASAVKTKWIFVAHVSSTGNVSTVEVDPDRAEIVIAQERAKVREQLRKLDSPERRRMIKELEEEFPPDTRQRKSKSDE